MSAKSRNKPGSNTRRHKAPVCTQHVSFHLDLLLQFCPITSASQISVWLWAIVKSQSVSSDQTTDIETQPGHIKFQLSRRTVLRKSVSLTFQFAEKLDGERS